MDNLSERLRAQADSEPAGIDTFYRRLFTEAADTITAQAAEIERLRAHIHLHAGDTNSLNNEVELMRDHWQDAESRLSALEALLDEFCNLRSVWTDPHNDELIRRAKEARHAGN